MLYAPQPSVRIGNTKHQQPQQHVGNQDRNDEGCTQRKLLDEKNDGDVIQGANLRNVWMVASFPFTKAHFATFPPDLIRPCILAGTSEKGCCIRCGAPWVRRVQTKGGLLGQSWNDHHDDYGRGNRMKAVNRRNPYTRTTLDWQPTCECNADTRPCIVLDCFAGAGTTGLVADQLGRDAILIEINSEYAKMARQRIAGDAPLFTQVD